MKKSAVLATQDKVPEALNIEPKKAYRILVLEDDPMIRLITKRILKTLGCNVDACKDGSEGYKRFLERQYDLVITDFSMPEKTGGEFAQDVRAEEARREETEPLTKIPIICLSSDEQTENAHLFTETYLKPGTRAIITQILKEHLGFVAP